MLELSCRTGSVRQSTWLASPGLDVVFCAPARADFVTLLGPRSWLFTFSLENSLRGFPRPAGSPDDFPLELSLCWVLEVNGVL